ncbi:MAG: flavin reductase family protein [Pseudomonadota bacterium]
MHMDTPKLPQSFAPDADNSRALRDAFGKFATGITLITCAGNDGPVTIVANSFASVSLDPALVLWCLDHGSNRYQHFEAAEHYAIHVLHAGQKALCDAAAKDAHALSAGDVTVNSDGVPLIEDCLARFECRRVAVHAAGDHDIIVGKVARVSMQDGAPLTFYGGKIGALKP